MKAIQVMSPLRMALSVVLLICVGVIGSCVRPMPSSPASGLTAAPAPNAGLANPASVFCTEKSGQLKIERDAQGNESGVCVFPDGSRCDEWAFFRGECKPGQSLAATMMLTEAALRNGRYDLPDLGGIELKDGKFEKRYGDGATQVNTAGFLTAAFGDLNGDSANDAAVVVWWSGGGSGTFVHLAAVLNDKGAPRQAAIVFLGDRTNVETLAIKEGRIVLSVRERLSSTAVEKQYILQGDKLVEVTAVTELTGTAWVWQGLLMNNGLTRVPSDPYLYTLAFLPDGRVSIRADCNMAGGAYRVEGKKLSFGPLAATLAACPPGSLYDEYLQRLGEVESYLIQDGKLILLLQMDSGSLKFAPLQLTGTYLANMPAADAAGRQMVLNLNADGSAALTTTFTGKPGSFVSKGTWRGSGISMTVRLTESDGKPIQNDITFELRGDELVSTAWDRNLYGSSGLRLSKVTVESGSVTGVVTYLPRIALAPNAVIEVRLLDISRQDTPAPVIVTQTIQAAGKQVPISFELKFDPAVINPQATYAVQARITEDGRLAWTSTRFYPVLTQGAAARAEVIVEQVAQPAADAGPGGVRFDPKTFRCANEPQRIMTEKQWQVYGTIEGSQPNQPGKPGQPARVGLRIKFGEASDNYEVTVTVTAPDGSQAAARGTIKAAEWFELTYPQEFAGAKPTVPGIYTIVWQVKGGSVACYGFEIGAQ